jgi:hypothetical protein
MTTILLATGVFASGGVAVPSDVTTPAARRIRLTQSAGAVAPQSMDPTDTLDFIIDLTAIPDEPHEDFASITLVIVPASAALGFQVLSAPPYAPEEIGNGEIRIWATVDSASRGLAAWSQGTTCSIEVTATTDSTPPRVFQRTASIQVAQK